MKQTRREFAAMLTAAALPLPALWERAEREYEQTGEVSGDTALALLDAQGERGIYTEPKHLDELRVSLAKKLRDHKIIRAVNIPDDVQPLLHFKR